MKKYVVFLIWIYFSLNAMEHSGHVGASVEDILEILYSRYLINRANRNIQSVSTDYKFIIYHKTFKKDLVIPTYYEVGFRIENHANGTYTLHSIYAPRRLEKSEVEHILQSVSHHYIPTRSEAQNTYSYMAEHLFKVVASYSPSLTYDVVEGRHQLEINESDKVREHPWFTISPCTMCVQISDALHPKFICKTRVAGERLQRVHSIIPHDKTISQFDLRAAAAIPVNPEM